MIEYEPELMPDLPPAQDTNRQKWAAFHRAHPAVFVAISTLAWLEVDHGCEYLSMRDIFGDLRKDFGGLNNTFAAFYTDALIEKYPYMAAYFHTRRRAAKPMRLVNVR